MKTKRLAYYALGTVLMLSAASCSDDIPGDQNEVYTGPIVTNYLNVNLVAGGGQATRAEAGEDGIYHTDDGDYVDGTGYENQVTGVRFYFFQESGSAAEVKAKDGSFVNYMDCDPTETLTPDDDNVEKLLNAELVISTKEGDKLPYSIVAIVNPPQALKDVEITSIAGDEATSLNKQVANYGVQAEGPFVMSNSVYLNSENQYEEQVPVAGHLYTSPGAALADPVTIYVERVNAKAQTTVTTGAGLVPANTTEGPFANMQYVYKTGEEIENSIGDDIEDGEEIYVQFLGWNVTCTTNLSYLMKHISNASNWNNEDLFGSAIATDWNSPTRFRSFWAINPTLQYLPFDDKTNYVYGDFEHAQSIPGFVAGNANYTYLQENAGFSAASPATAHPTQLIVAAQLLNSKGELLTLAEYGFNQYTLEGLQKKYASQCNIYIKSDVDGGKFVKIPYTGITFQTAMQAGQTNVNTQEALEAGGRYYVYAKLNTEDQTIKAALESNNLYIGNNPESSYASESAINTSLIGLGHAKIWEGGRTYYFIDIKHLGLDGSAGGVGIVRNHIYSMNINSLQGLGTPVYDPDEVIYPEKPKDEDTYIGAEIKILNWRLVNQNVGFVW